MDLPKIAVFYRPGLVHNALCDAITDDARFDYVGAATDAEGARSYFNEVTNVSCILLDAKLPFSDPRMPGMQYSVHMPSILTKLSPSSPIILVDDTYNLGRERQSFCSKKISGYVALGGEHWEPYDKILDGINFVATTPNGTHFSELVEVGASRLEALKDPFEVLSETQFKVFFQCGLGRQPKEAAQHLKMEKKQVERQVEAAYKKLQYSGTLELREAACYYVANGSLPVNPS